MARMMKKTQVLVLLVTLAVACVCISVSADAGSYTDMDLSDISHVSIREIESGQAIILRNQEHIERLINDVLSEMPRDEAMIARLPEESGDGFVDHDYRYALHLVRDDGRALQIFIKSGVIRIEDRIFDGDDITVYLIDGLFNGLTSEDPAGIKPLAG